jgi:hypothetical protein
LTKTFSSLALLNATIGFCGREDRMKAPGWSCGTGEGRVENWRTSIEHRGTAAGSTTETGEGDGSGSGVGGEGRLVSEVT